MPRQRSPPPKPRHWRNEGPMELAAFAPCAPELVLLGGALALLMLGVFRGDKIVDGIDILAMIILVVAALLVVLQPAERVEAFGGRFVIDGYGRFFKFLALIGAAAALLMSVDFMRRENPRRFEFGVLILTSAAGMMTMISARDLIALYLGLELMSLSLYVIAAIDRDNLRSTEAGLKYFVLGALSSGMLLYGASLIYGFTGTISFHRIADAARTGCGSLAAE